MLKSLSDEQYDHLSSGGGLGRGVMGWTKGFNFRGSAGYVTDGRGETYVTNDLYPTTRNNVTFGWDILPPERTNDSSAVDRRLAGGHWIRSSQSGTVCTFRIDLPGPGDYEIRLSQGRQTTGTPYRGYVLFDDDVILHSVPDEVLGGVARFSDANEVIHLGSAAWVAGNTPRLYSFASSVVRIQIASRGLGNPAHLVQLNHFAIRTPGNAAARRRRLQAYQAIQQANNSMGLL